MTVVQKKYNATRTGFTLIELFVSLAIIGLLLALILPAVLYSRETVRRISCRNNLHQFGIALENHVAMKGHYPDAEVVFRELLPGLENTQIYQQIISGDYDSDPTTRPRLAIFRCPTDPLDPAPDTLNYAANVGTGTLVDGLNGFFTTESPTFVPTNADLSGTSFLTRPRDITDGLSNTVALAEMLPTGFEGMSPPPSPVTDVRRIDWLIDPALTLASEFDELVERCSAIKDNPNTGVRTGTVRGWPWSVSVRNFGLATYHHVLSPNMPSCLDASISYAIFSAGSFHANGVNVLFGDGRVEFISDSIDREVWKKLGSRAAASDE